MTASFANPLPLAPHEIAGLSDAFSSSNPRPASRGSNSHPSDMETLQLQKRQTELVGSADGADSQVVSADNYSDTAVYTTIRKARGMTVLLYAAIQTAIVGEGYEGYGEFSLDGQKYDLRAIFKEYGVKDDMDTNAKLQPGDLTPRRLQRFFRYQIRAYLEANDTVSPYLWKKYSTLDPRYRSITFPGAESLVETQDEGLYLLETYKTLDERLGTN
ncbi:hypothetical protein BGZ91_002083, partial [Linnemannia elongata]